jgi:hypothetical protein
VFSVDGYLVLFRQHWFITTYRKHNFRSFD